MRGRALEIMGAVAGLCGYLLVIRWPGSWWALLPWAVANPLNVVVSWRAGLKWQALLWMFYFAGTFAGLVMWGRV